jgi:hypothetical protein
MPGHLDWALCFATWGAPEPGHNGGSLATMESSVAVQVPLLTSEESASQGKGCISAFIHELNWLLI